MLGTRRIISAMVSLFSVSHSRSIAFLYFVLTLSPNAQKNLFRRCWHQLLQTAFLLTLLDCVAFSLHSYIYAYKKTPNTQKQQKAQSSSTLRVSTRYEFSPSFLVFSGVFLKVSTLNVQRLALHSLPHSPLIHFFFCAVELWEKDGEMLNRAKRKNAPRNQLTNDNTTHNKRRVRWIEKGWQLQA